MGRMYTAGKGISASALPYRRNSPKWITMTPSAVCELINKLARKGISYKNLIIIVKRSYTKLNRCYS